MKSKFTKKCTWLFGLIAVASAIGGGVNLVNASAETTAEQTAIEQAIASFDMVYGASVRISSIDANAKSENGIRYMVSLPKTQYELLKSTYQDLTFGVLIAPEAWLIEGYELTEENVFGENACYGYAEWNGEQWVYEGEKPQIVHLSSKTMTVSKDDANVMEYAGAMVNIRDGSDAQDTTNNLTRQFRGVGYLSYTAGSTKEYVFVGDDDNVRSMTYVAQKLIADTSEKNWLTPEQKTWMQTNYVDKVTEEATSYQVAHYVQNAKGEYTLKETETFSEGVTIDDEVTAEPKTYEYYTCNEEKSVLTAKAYANGKTCLNVYYDVAEATTKEDLNKYLKFESEAAMASLVSGMTQIAYEASANADGGYAVKLNMNSGENRKAKIDLKSLYQLKEIESIEIKFAFSNASNAWSRFAFNVNGVAKDTETDDEYMLLSLGRQNDYGANVYTTKTFTKETLIQAGMTEEDYLEYVIIENLPGLNVAAYIWVDSITINVANEEPETNIEAQRAELASLLKFESETAMTSLVSGMTQIAYEASANAAGGYAVKLNMNSGENRKATIDLKSLYQLKEIESIEIRFAFSKASNVWSRFAFNVNGVAKDTDTDAEYMLLSLGRQNDYGENVYTTKTFTKATLIQAGMTEEDYLKNVIIENLPGLNVAAYIWIDSITINVAS